MDLRPLVLILAAAELVASPVKRFPLDNRSVYTIAVSPAAPTTVMFPGPITALDGAGVSPQAEDNPSVLLSHQPGAPFFSVRALRDGAAAAVNVVYRESVYALAFVAGNEPDRTVTFQAAMPAAPAALTPDRLISLLERARAHAELARQYPGLVQRVEHRRLALRHEVGDLRVGIEEAWHFEDERVLVFRVRLANPTATPVTYAPADLAVDIAGRRFPVAVTDATGDVPPGRAVVFLLAILGDPTGARGVPTLDNPFRIAITP